MQLVAIVLATGAIVADQPPRVRFDPVASFDLAVPDPVDAVAGDFNQDGHLDLLVSSKAASGTNVNVFTGDGTGSLVKGGGFTFVQATAVAAADFNGDGYLDAVVTQNVANKDGSYGDGICGSLPGIALALGPAFSSPRCLIAPPRSIAVQTGDFDGDGRPEIAVVSASAQGLKIYRLAFAPFLTYSTLAVPGGNIAATSMAPPIDLNGDGTLDLVVGYRGGVKVFLGNGDATFAPAGGALAGGSAAAVAVGGIDADDRPDIVWVESDVNARLLVGLGNGDGTFTTRVVGPLPAGGTAAVAVADIDQDGNTDITLADTRGAGVRIYYGNGDGTFVAHPALTVSPRPKLLVARDWDEDGDVDLTVLDGKVPGGNAVGWMALHTGHGPADSAGPAVSLIAPSAHERVEGRIAVAARASDDVGVVRVDFYADDVLVGTSAGPPYIASWDTAASRNGPVAVAAWAYDAAGNLTRSSVTDTTVANAPRRDSTPPAVAVPQDVTTDATGPDGAVFSFTSTATDDVDGTLPVTCAPASGATFTFGPTSVACSATDAAGNSASASFTVTVEDLSPPAVTAPSDTVLEATGADGAAFEISASANDVVDGSVPASCDHDRDRKFPLGVTPVTCTATDALGNTGSAAFTVTVTDTTPPVVQVPPDAVLEATSPGGAVYTYTATSSDIVDGEGIPSCVPASGATFPLGATAVACTAADAHGNAASAGFIVVVRDAPIDGLFRHQR